jgi:hypothetical protein
MLTVRPSRPANIEPPTVGYKDPRTVSLLPIVTLDGVVYQTIVVNILKWAVIVPALFMTAVVDAADEFPKVIDPVALQ